MSNQNQTQNQISFEGKTNAEVKEVIFDLSEYINHYQQLIQLARQELAKRAQELSNTAKSQKLEQAAKQTEAPVLTVAE